MDQEKRRIEEDLRGLIQGEVRCDDAFVQMYASDASIYEIRPLGVVRPRSTADVVTCVQYASAHQIPVHARGSGSGLAGQCLGPGLVMDFSHAMRRILYTDEHEVRVQPGVVLGHLNRHLASQGRYFGPDPSTSQVTTIGGMLATNAGGSHWIKVGSTSGRVVRLQVVLADGAVVEAGQHPVSLSGPHPSDRREQLLRRVADLLTREADTITRCQPKSLVNRCGYALAGSWADGQVNLAQILSGSEGTLGLVTEAVLHTDPLPAHVGVALLFFDRLQTAARAALEIRRGKATACDLMDRRIVNIARETDVRYDVLLPADAEAVLLVEYQGETRREVEDGINQMLQSLSRRRRLTFGSHVALEPEDVQLCWGLATNVVPRLYRLKGSARPIPFVEDIAVPPERLPEFLVALQNTLKKHQVTASLFGHAAHGQLHIRPFLNLADPADIRRMQDLARDLYEHVLKMQGTISGEHGDGLSRSWYVREQYGPLYDVFRQLKRIFDPQNIFNPGKIVDDVAQPLTQHLRQTDLPQPSQHLATDVGSETPAGSPPSTGLPILQLHWTPADVMATSQSCNGCGGCRTLDTQLRMCPIYRFAPTEEASPRAKANLMRAVLSGQMEASALTSETVKDIADLCVNCHQCRLECPARVDIPRLMIECKAQYVATNGLSVWQWCMTRLDVLSTWGGYFPRLTNWAFTNRAARWLLERSTGIAQGRKLPRLAQRSFLRRGGRRHTSKSITTGKRKVVLFLDIYANWYDVQLADALIAILEHHQVDVLVHPNQLPSGMTMISMGAVEPAKKLARRNIPLLAEAVRQGYHVITTEPSAALCLTHEYPQLIDDADAQLVADHTTDACAYLWQMHQQGELRLEFQPVNATIGYHQPCHLRALGVGTPGSHLMQLIPGVTVRQLEKGCSGMAGTFGLQCDNYRTSLRVGWPLISAMRDPDLQIGATECTACKMQMEQGTQKPTIHPIKVLALAYRLLPEMNSLLLQHNGPLWVT